MNTNIALKILLIISIVLQSFIVVSASMETHQLDVEHLQTIHDHETDHSPQLDKDNEHDIEDCHHCGHCSGNNSSWVLVKDFSAIDELRSINISPYQFDQKENLLDAILRPPIS